MTLLEEYAFEDCFMDALDEEPNGMDMHVLYVDYYSGDPRYVVTIIGWVLDS